MATQLREDMEAYIGGAFMLDHSYIELLYGRVNLVRSRLGSLLGSRFGSRFALARAGDVAARLRLLLGVALVCLLWPTHWPAMLTYGPHLTYRCDCMIV